MTSRTVTIDPVTRIEGHMRVKTRVENGVVVDAHCSADMFRGIEKALEGYDARAAQQVTQRVCGICPYGHAEAASLALENALGVKPNRNGQILRNLIVGAYQLHDFLLHFYTLCVLDFIDIAAVLHYGGGDADLLRLKAWVAQELASEKVFPAAPFFPRYKGNYAEDQELNVTAIKHYMDAIPMLADLHKMVAIFGAKAPHPTTIEAGGVTTVPTAEKIAYYRTLLQRAETFVHDCYRNDVMAVAHQFKDYFRQGKGYGQLLSYAYLPNPDGQHHAFSSGVTLNGQYAPLDVQGITEEHAYSYYQETVSGAVKPLGADVQPIGWQEFQKERDKAEGKYSWCRAPRYQGQVMEVGPAARIVNTYLSGTNPKLNRLADSINQQFGITLSDYPSVMGRHVCRYMSASLIIDTLKEQLEQVEPDKVAFVEAEVPKNAVGVGLTEATRGSLGHWIETDGKGQIRRYTLIVPTTWNMSPRDRAGQPGALEKMLIGTPLKDPDHPMEPARIIRSIDPCLACSVH